MKVFVLGGSGMLGAAFVKHMRAANHLVFAVSHTQLDATDYNALSMWIALYKPDVIVNFVAICDMEKCELNPAEAVRVNALVSANAALVASNFNIEYVFISSACVFDGEKYAYDTLDTPCPISIYGKTKLMGEAIAKTVPRHYIVRSEWCFGGGPLHDTKFLGKIYRQIASGATEISAVTDKFSSLSYIVDLVKGIELMIGRSPYGTYHITCKGSASRYEVACEFIRLIGVADSVTIHPVVSSEFTKDYFAPRPVSERLINTKIEGFEPRDWHECLAEYSQEFVVDLALRARTQEA
jgi:dTDP-4-dehydrorhamnose reductase